MLLLADIPIIGSNIIFMHAYYERYLKDKIDMSFVDEKIVFQKFYQSSVFFLKNNYDFTSGYVLPR